METVEYVNTSFKFETLKLSSGEVWEVTWKLIPETHYDEKLRSKRPAWFAKHEGVVYICPKRRKG